MSIASDFVERANLIKDAGIAENADLFQKLALDLDSEQVSFQHKPDGSVIYKFHDQSFMRVCGIDFTVATQQDYGSCDRIKGRLSL